MTTKAGSEGARCSPKELETLAAEFLLNVCGKEREACLRFEEEHVSEEVNFLIFYYPMALDEKLSYVNNGVYLVIVFKKIEQFLVITYVENRSSSIKIIPKLVLIN
ncbi:hypothetical protein VPH35_072889 [Triticum aestivum]